MPACEPVNDRAWAPRAWMAIATSAFEMRSPAVSSMSISRGGGAGETRSARSSSSSVVSPIAETTTTTSLPSLCVRTIRSATFLIRSASWTDDPPYFCTTSATADLLFRRRAARSGREPTLPGPLRQARRRTSRTTTATIRYQSSAAVP